LRILREKSENTTVVAAFPRVKTVPLLQSEEVGNIREKMAKPVAKTETELSGSA